MSKVAKPHSEHTCLTKRRIIVTLNTATSLLCSNFLSFWDIQSLCQLAYPPLKHPLSPSCQHSNQHLSSLSLSQWVRFHQDVLDPEEPAPGFPRHLEPALKASMLQEAKSLWWQALKAFSFASHLCHWPPDLLCLSHWPRGWPPDFLCLQLLVSPLSFALRPGQPLLVAALAAWTFCIEGLSISCCFIVFQTCVLFYGQGELQDNFCFVLFLDSGFSFSPATAPW